MARARSTDGELAQTWHSSASHQNKASPVLSSNKHFLRTERQEKEGKNPPSCLLLSLHHKKHGSYQSRNPSFLPSATWSTAVTPGKLLIVSLAGKVQLSSTFISEIFWAKETVGINGLRWKGIHRKTSTPVFIRWRFHHPDLSFWEYLYFWGTWIPL